MNSFAQYQEDSNIGIDTEDIPIGANNNILETIDFQFGQMTQTTTFLKLS